MYSVTLKHTKLILVCTQITYQATGDAGIYHRGTLSPPNNSCYSRRSVWNTPKTFYVALTPSSDLGVHDYKSGTVP